MMNDYIAWFDSVGMADVEAVGGKNASLGEMRRHLTALGIAVPNGFATTAAAYREFLAQDRLDQRIAGVLDTLDVDDVAALNRAGAQIRQWLLDAPFPDALIAALSLAYAELEKLSGSDLAVAVRSSATAEDLPDASFAGQQETYLNVRGLSAVMVAVRQVFASLYNDRAIAYRVHHGFPHSTVALSAGIQRMVRSDRGASGVIFTLDPETGFREVVLVTSAFGLGEMIVQGAVNPDEFYLYKANVSAGRPAIIRRNLGGKAKQMILGPSVEQATLVVDVPATDCLKFSITDADAERLAQHALAIEAHYGRPMDIEWAKDGIDGRLYIVQARPETVQSRGEQRIVQRYRLLQRGAVICEGRSIGQRIGAGRARIVKRIDQMSLLQPGEVLVADMTDPDWEPIMKKAAAIVVMPLSSHASWAYRPWSGRIRQRPVSLRVRM
jgi:pyruvate, water dikinase